MKLKSFVTALLIMTLTGCATIFSGTSQTINVKVVDATTQVPLQNVSCVVSDGNNSYTMAGNPSAINISKGGHVVINCSKPGYRQLNMAVGDSFNAVTIVNVLFWPGFIVDAVSGAYKKYPSHYLINMQRVK